MTTNGVEPSEVRYAKTEEITCIWDERWGLPIVTPARRYSPSDVEGLVLVPETGEATGLITWKVMGTSAEIVTLDAWPSGRGSGATLLRAAEQEFRERGVERLFLVTTNDNARALRFYIRHGYRLVRLHLDAMDRVREEKPAVPLTGTEGLLLRDMWGLKKRLGPEAVAEAAWAKPRQLTSSGSPFEDMIGFSRAVRVGDLVVVSGTAPIGDDGETVGAGDLYLQTQHCIEVAGRALKRAGASLAEVVRTRLLLTSMDRWQEAARAHQEAFGVVRPASTFVQVVGFIDPEWLVEIEINAVASSRPPDSR